MAAPHDVAHLVSLIEAAKAQADALGAAGGGVVAPLDQALRAARALGAEDGRVDEGLRTDELTTGNDK